MATINKLPKKEKAQRTDNTPMRELRRTAYNSTTWRRLREVYMHQHPLCEECLKKNKVTPAQSIHHIKSPFEKGVINYQLLLDPDNLMAVCNECHGEIHNREQGNMSAKDIIAQLDKLFDENITDEELDKELEDENKGNN